MKLVDEVGSWLCRLRNCGMLMTTRSRHRLPNRIFMAHNSGRDTVGEKGFWHPIKLSSIMTGLSSLEVKYKKKDSLDRLSKQSKKERRVRSTKNDYCDGSAERKN